MALMKITCPDCGAGLKSPTGFKVGQAVRCPKCKSQFAVEEPEEEPPTRPAKKPVRAVADDEDDRPRRKPVRAAAADEDEDDRPRRKPVRDEDEDEDEDDDRPRKKKKKKRRDDDEDKGNMAFYIRIGVLLTILLVLGIVFLVLGPGGLTKIINGQ